MARYRVQIEFIASTKLEKGIFSKLLKENWHLYAGTDDFLDTNSEKVTYRKMNVTVRQIK